MSLNESASRREVVGRVGLGALGLLALAACGGAPATLTAPPTPSPTKPDEAAVAGYTGTAGSFRRGGAPLNEPVVPVPTFPAEAQIPAKDRLKEVDSLLAKDMPPGVKSALERVTISYPGRQPRGEFHRLRKVAFSDRTTQELVTRARRGELYFPPSHVAVVAELEYLHQWAALPTEKRNGLLDVYADSIINGLLKKYNPDKLTAIAIEAGHKSVAPKDKIEEINAERRAQGLPAIRLTEDTGAAAEVIENGQVRTIWEPEANLQVSQLVAAKILKRYPNWIPILNSDESGFPVDRFPQVRPETTHYIQHRDALLSLMYKWETLAAALKLQGVDKVRVSIHFNGGPPNAKGGLMLAQNSKYAAESSALAEAIAESLTRGVQVHIPGYTNEVNYILNKDPLSPYWMLGDYEGDDPRDIRAGRVNSVRGATGRVLAQIRADALTPTAVPVSPASATKPAGTPQPVPVFSRDDYARPMTRPSNTSTTRPVSTPTPPRDREPTVTPTPTGAWQGQV